jgi:hypothetical protein
MTIAVAHRDASGRAVLDAVRERRPPFSPDAVVEEFAALLRSYGIGKVHGDRYGGQWPRERFNTHGILYIAADKPKSDLYRDLLPVLNSGRVELLDLPRLAGQLCALERRTARGGRDTIDHPLGGRDDVANAVAGAVVLATARKNVVIAGPIIFSANRSIGFDNVMEAGGAWDRLMREEGEIAAARERRRVNP